MTMSTMERGVRLRPKVTGWYKLRKVGASVEGGSAVKLLSLLFQNRTRGFVSGGKDVLWAERDGQAWVPRWILLG